MFGVTRKLSSMTPFGSKILSHRAPLVLPSMPGMDTGRMVFSTGLVDTIGTKQPNSSSLLKMNVGRCVGVPSRAFRISASVFSDEAKHEFEKVAHADYITPGMVDAMIEITKKNPSFGIHALKACQKMEIRPVLPSPNDEAKILKHFLANEENLVAIRIEKAKEIWDLLLQAEKNGRIFELSIDHYNAHLQIRLSDENFDLAPTEAFEELKELYSELKHSPDKFLKPNVETFDILIEKCRQEGDSYGSAVLHYIKRHWCDKSISWSHEYRRTQPNHDAPMSLSPFPKYYITVGQRLQLFLAGNLIYHKKEFKQEMKDVYIYHVAIDICSLSLVFVTSIIATATTLVIWPGIPFVSFLKKGEFLSLIVAEYMNRKDKGALLARITRLLFSMYMLACLMTITFVVIKGIKDKKGRGTIFGEVISVPVLVFKKADDAFEGLKTVIQQWKIETADQTDFKINQRRYDYRC